jgi:hypothetical protein
MFFLQAVSDAPFFNMYRGVHTVGGGVIKEGSEEFELAQLNRALGHTGLLRDLQMDYVERTSMIGWSQHVEDMLGTLPGAEAGIAARVHNWAGRLILKNELHYINSQIGDVVTQALDLTRTELKERAALAKTPEEAALWQRELDQVPMFEHLREQASKRLGRVATDEEVGRDYIAEMVEDSRLEIRTSDGLLNYTKAHAKGSYHMPTDVGELRPLDLDYLAESLGWANVHDAPSLRQMIGPSGKRSMKELQETLRQLDYHPDHIQRSTTALMFNWRDYFDGLRTELGMSTGEMMGIEEMVVNAARSAGMKPVDYITQVMTMTGKNARKAGKAATGAQYASEGRTVTEAELEAMRQRGEAILTGDVRSVQKKPVDLQAAIDSVADDLYQRTALKEWGGASYSPRTGTFIEAADPWMYHGTSASIVPRVKKSGIQNGTFTSDLSDKAIPRGPKSVIYRAKRMGNKWSNDKFPEWQRGRAIPPQNLQISKDGGTTWENVTKDSTVAEGPWVSGTGETTSISIADAQDPVKFRAALDQFVADNAEALQKQGNYVGTFRDEKLGEVQFNVSVATFNRADTEAVQVAGGRAGGAYDVSTGNGLFAPKLSNMAGVTGDLKYALDVMRLVKKGEAGLNELTALVADHLQPSMKVRLLAAFEERLQGPKGLIAQAMESGDTATSQALNDVLLDLRGGWGLAADKEFRDMVVRRAGGEVIGDPEVERAARYFSKFLQEISPKLTAGEQLKSIVDNIPVEGASPHNFTEGVLQNTLAEGYRMAEKDAIRLAHMDTERSVLNRSLNHPFFALYPTSYMYGKVIPETFRFIGYKPFGVQTGVGALNFYKVQQSVALQSQYDDGMQSLWEGLGKSAVVGLLSYISPSMPWEDMSGRLPPWLSRGIEGEDLWAMTQAEFDTFSPERWIKHFQRAAGEVGDVGAAAVDAAAGALSPEEQKLSNETQQPAPPVAPTVPLPDFNGPVPGASLAPILGGEMDRLQQVLSGK